MQDQLIVIAPDHFKDSLSAAEAADAIKRGLSDSLDQNVWSVLTHPLADGGEGTVEAFVEAKSGKYREDIVSGPLGDEVNAKWGTFESNGTAAVIEMAEASGYELLDASERNPMKATTYGTGELINEALECGVDEIFVGLGGSATVDGGLGMIRALGFEVLDDPGEPVKYPDRLIEAKKLVRRDVPDRLSEVNIIACVDVDNPLLGEDGAARVYGPQKGADPNEVQRLENCLSQWADLVETECDVSAREQEGAGAAGGLGFGFSAVLGAELRSGARAVMDETDFNSVLENAEVLLTGEGKLDEQTLYGKTTHAAARRAREYEVPLVIALGGQVPDRIEDFHPLFDCVLSCLNRPMTLNDALDRTDSLLKSTSRELGNLIKLLQMNE